LRIVESGKLSGLFGSGSGEVPVSEERENQGSLQQFSLGDTIRKLKKETGREEFTLAEVTHRAINHGS